MAAPELIGYDATGRKTESQLDEIVEQYKKFLEDTTPFFRLTPAQMSFVSLRLSGGELVKDLMLEISAIHLLFQMTTNQESLLVN